MINFMPNGFDSPAVLTGSCPIMADVVCPSPKDDDDVERLDTLDNTVWLVLIPRVVLACRSARRRCRKRSSASNQVVKWPYSSATSQSR